MSLDLLERPATSLPALRKAVETVTVETLLADLGRRLADRPLTERTTFEHWLTENYFIDGRRFGFEGYEPLQQVYFDDHPDMVIMKSAQCRISEYLIAYAFYFALQREENVFYAMPAKDQIKDFVMGRVDPRIDESPRLQALIRKTDNSGLKQVGLNFIYFRGSQNQRQIKSVDAGCDILDEFDEMVQKNVPTMKKRLGSSKYGIVKEASTPTYFEYGIHAEYLKSDQNEYFLKCDKCGKWQTPDWLKNIRPAPTRDKAIPNPDRVDLVCSDCGEPLNRAQEGEWRPQNPGALKRGYHISKLIFKVTNLLALWIEYRDTLNLQDFHNGNLGQPYAPAGGKLDDLALNGCREAYTIEKATGCTMGVDVGDLYHVRVSMKDGTKKKAVFIGTVKNTEELDRFMKKFDVRRCVIDGLPETREATKFALRFPGRVFLAYYLLKDPNKTYEFKKTEKPLKVLINRTRAMDETGNRFIERENIIPMEANTIPGYYDQLKAPQKIKVTGADGNEAYSYVEGSRADHYYHAEVYDDIAGQGQQQYGICVV
ncbi:MAG: phage terminase large subunit family protein [Candidatus Margulisiibacteriota bacterium]